MILSTLPDLPGRTYDVISMVLSRTWLDPWGKGNELDEMVKTICQQATSVGADAIIDIKITVSSGTDTGYGANVVIGTAVVVIGTAVKLR
jgi:hypothetical protein